MNTPHVGPQRLQITRTCFGLFGAQGLKTYVEPEEDPAQHGLDKALIRIIRRLYWHQLGMLEELPRDRIACRFSMKGMLLLEFQAPPQKDAVAYDHDMPREMSG